MGAPRTDRTTASGVCPTPPVSGLGRLVEQLEDELTRHQRRLGGVRAELAALSDRYAHRSGRPGSSAEGCEQVESVDGVRDRLEELAFFTTTSLCAVQPGGPQSPAAIAAARPLDLRGLRRGVRMRIIYRSDVLDDESNRAYLAELTAAGAEVRLSAQDLDRMIVMDGLVAVVPIEPSDSRRGALVVRQPGLVDPLDRLFARLWAETQPLPWRTPEQRAREPALTEADRRLLAMLASGGTDEAAARALGVSVRHLRRRIAALLRQLGATSRFEAGVLAARRNWI